MKQNYVWKWLNRDEIGRVNVWGGPANQKVIRGVLSVIVFIVSTSCEVSSIAVPTSTKTGQREEVITIVITVQVSEDVARALHKRGPSTAESDELLRIMETLGFALEPMHRDTDDPDLQGYFIVEVPDQATAQRVMNRLQQSAAVEATYIAPPHGLP